MANSRIPDLTNYTNPDGTNDVIPIWDNANSQTKKITRNNYLGITGSPVGSSDSQVLSNKTLGNTNTLTIKDNLFTLQDNGDVTKQGQFDLSGNTTGTTRTYTLPNATGTLVDLASSQTLTNKTLTSPVITGGSIDNSTVTVDAITGHSSANTGSIYGISVTSSKISGSALTNSTVTADKLSTGAANATVATSETTTSTSYTNLTTTTDSVTATIGANGTAAVSLYCHFSNSGLGNYSLMAVDISGANTVAAADATASGGNINASSDLWLGTTFLLTGLVAGSTVFKAKYRVSAGTGTFSARRIAVIPL